MAQRNHSDNTALAWKNIKQFRAMKNSLEGVKISLDKIV